MKALILAAGFGSRLMPHTSVRPKPLFTLNGIPALQYCIEQIIKAGCTDIIINTHHLHHQIEHFIDACNRKKMFPVSLSTIYEPQILDTGGAIKNVREFMGNEHFIVINSDIISDIDLMEVWNFHVSGNFCATLVLHDCPVYNKVCVDKNLFVKGFSEVQKKEPSEDNISENRLFAFTGIQVLSPEIFDHMPDKKSFSSIDIYSELANHEGKVKAFICKEIFWQDIGTPETYRDVAIKFLAGSQLKAESEPMFESIEQIVTEKLAGDGSDRGWFRCYRHDRPDVSVIVADHGIHNQQSSLNDKNEEIDSFIQIGNHLALHGIPVPAIRTYDRFAGLVVLEDLGNLHLANLVNSFDNAYSVPECYKQVCNLAINFSIKGIQDFDDRWTFQTPSYSREMILEKECCYFVEAFLQKYLEQDVKFDDFIHDFEFIADHALEGSFQGLMHRDMQSRNIMVKDGKYFFIDFQSARKGPLQYDLASLLIDPYVNLSDEIRETLLHECANDIEQLNGVDAEKFIQCYRYCALTRNMQMLGAFSHLSMNRGKILFEQYIPVALENLKKNIILTDTENISTLYNHVIKL